MIPASEQIFTSRRHSRFWTESLTFLWHFRILSSLRFLFINYHWLVQGIVFLYGWVCTFSAAKVEIPMPPARTLELISQRKKEAKETEISVSAKFCIQLTVSRQSTLQDQWIIFSFNWLIVVVGLYKLLGLEKLLKDWLYISHMVVANQWFKSLGECIPESMGWHVCHVVGNALYSCGLPFLLQRIVFCRMLLKISISLKLN